MTYMVEPPICCKINGYLSRCHFNEDISNLKKFMNIPTAPLVRACHIFAHWGCSLCSKKCAQLVFSCFWLQTWCVLKFEKKLSILWYSKFQLITAKYHEVEALFCKISRHVEKLGLVHTKCQYQVTVLGYRSCIRDKNHFTTLKWP